MVAGEFMEDVPGVQTAVVSIREDQLYGVVTYGFNAGDGYRFLADLKYLVAPPVSAHFCRRRRDA